MRRVGIALALVIWVTATAVGLSALLRASSEVLFALKLAGACYLAYLGIQTLLASRSRAVRNSSSPCSVRMRPRACR